MLNLSVTKGKNYRFLTTFFCLPSFLYYAQLSLLRKIKHGGLSRQTAGRRAQKQEDQELADCRPWCGMLANFNHLFSRKNKKKKSDLCANFSGVNTPIVINFKLPNVKSLNTDLGRDTQLHIIIQNVYHRDTMNITLIAQIMIRCKVIRQ